MDLLACPYDKHFPLELYVVEVNKYEERNVSFRSKPACELYCAFRGKEVKEFGGKDPGCDECIKYEVKTGVLYCPTCQRWYPIKDEIPVLLPDDLRKKDEDLKFLMQIKDKIPEKIWLQGKPFNLSEK
ncbi:Trm112 family protein [Thermofilum sp.]|jgi:uncharacterized protein YbaR (Trm112 family)|uniref:Trm112 family protein n=1 Tax=Thermofilum sp. TaxID=1961369 RepID=UPI00258A2A5A|nr:Trm112 family protein [Thermofilum sp.]